MISINCYSYCRDDISKIKNYDLAIADEDHVWDCHHVNELTFTANELIKMNMYYQRPADELVFLSKSEHKRLHCTVCAGHAEMYKKISEANKGKMPWNTGKHHSEETRAKISEAGIGRIVSEETRAKISAIHKGKTSGAKGKHWTKTAKQRSNSSKALKGLHKGKHWKLIDGKRVWY